MENLPAWLTELLESVNFKDYAKRLSPIEDGEKIIGTIGKEAQALYAAWSKQIEICNKLRENHEKEHQSLDHTRGQCEQFAHDYGIESQKCDALKELFWATAQIELNASSGVGIRKGWRLVKLPKKSGIRIIELGTISIQ